MFNKSNILGGALAMALAGRAPQAPIDYGYFPKGKVKPKHNGPNPLRGYYNRYSHVLSTYFADSNLAAKFNGSGNFKGFRKVRKFIPETGMSVWVPVNQ